MTCNKGLGAESHAVDVAVKQHGPQLSSCTGGENPLPFHNKYIAALA